MYMYAPSKSSKGRLDPTASEVEFRLCIVKQGFWDAVDFALEAAVDTCQAKRHFIPMTVRSPF